MNQNDLIQIKQLEKTIDLRNHQIDKYLNLDNMAQKWEIILQHQCWQHLKKLYLGFCEINDDNITIFTSLDWSQLQHLSLFYNKFSGLAIHKIVCCNTLTNINFLELKNNNIGSLGVKYLIKVNIFNLKHLNISKCKIGNEGIKYLSLGNWNKLEELSIHQNYITAGSIDYLTLGDWPKISVIWLYQNYENCIELHNLFALFKQNTKLTFKIKNRYFYSSLAKIEYSKKCLQ